MNESAGFNMEGLVSVPPLEEGGTIKPPKFEDMMCTLKTLQQGKSILDKEISDLNISRDCLLKEKHTRKSQIMEIQVYQLEEIHKEKEELLKKLEFQCEENGQDCAKQMEQSKFHCDVLEQYKCEIQEFRLKLQKQRVKLENQLLDLMEQHKILESMFTLKNLPDEIKRAENTNLQLLSVEQAKMALLCQLNEELKQVRKQMQLETTTTEIEEE